MVVLITHKLPNSIRGRLKLWFIEPKPQVFISNLNGKNADNIIDMITKNSPPEAGGIIIRSNNSIDGFSVTEFGKSLDKIFVLDGICIFKEKTNPS